ncbi:MAG: class I SAM-dependent methyltransferase [Acidobacteriia bacterium]|nr:class I SAM-dependent methyltransferase [Terriglobia bacterium]
MDIVQISDTAGGGAQTPEEETLVQHVREEGVVQIRRKSRTEPYDLTLLPGLSDLYLPRKTCRTTLSMDLIVALMERTEFAWLCDNLARHEDSTSESAILERQLFSYYPRPDFAEKRLLDFGCGNGPSSMTIARLLPRTEVVGVELGADKVEMANRIRAFRSLDNVRFLCSPSGSELPPGIGHFDFVMLSAVYEHLLPHERTVVMPALWSALKPGGMLFINRTPYRYFPMEVHSTGLWFVNYLPDRLAHGVVRQFAKRNRAINKSEDWNVHLRGGLRGGTEREIIRNLTAGTEKGARIVQPRYHGVRDRADYWLSGTNPNRYRRVKEWIARGFRLTDRLWGTVPSMRIEVVIQKEC